MRIISGTHKGRKIQAPKNLPVRPTTDMAKESLFNILNNHFFFDELSVLDLFTGTGSISFEFASRGSKMITSVDKHYGCIKFIESVAKELELTIQTIKSDVYKFLENNQQTYDIIFADPPYNFANEEFERIVELVFANTLLNVNGLLIIEHSKHTDLSGFSHFDNSRYYGGSVFSFFAIK